LAVALAVFLAFGKITGYYEFATGIATLTVLVLFLTGCQFVGLGILGAYIGRIYDETKRRPIFLVERALGFDSAGQKGREPGDDRGPEEFIEP
jgi:dolichol-phosphate mannosyltransferase